MSEDEETIAAYKRGSFKAIAPGVQPGGPSEHIACMSYIHQNAEFAQTGSKSRSGDDFMRQILSG
jgi:hypothetical protein